MKKYRRSIFFTKAPLPGLYRYRDVFQIFPADLENMPKSSLQNHFPNILEYWIDDYEKVTPTSIFEDLGELQEHFSDNATALRKEDKILGLLSAFTNNLFFRYRDLEGTWGIPVLRDAPEEEEANSWSSIWCLPLFHFPDLPRQFRIDTFTDVALPAIKRLPHIAFYTYYPNLDSDKTKHIILPHTIDLLFDAYFSLAPSTMSILDAAIANTVSAIELNNSRKTLSLLASFTAMETMVNLEYKDAPLERCPSCGQPRYCIAKKFREYLLKYIGNSQYNKKKFNAYYTLRSKIVHTGRQLRTELLFNDVPKADRDEELLTRTEILQIGKMSITNWLLKNQHGL
jgi:hypothetical protein